MDRVIFKFLDGVESTRIDVEGLRTFNCHLLREEKNFPRGNEKFEEKNTPFPFIITLTF